MKKTPLTEEIALRVARAYKQLLAGKPAEDGAEIVIRLDNGRPEVKLDEGLYEVEEAPFNSREYTAAYVSIADTTPFHFRKEVIRVEYSEL